MITLGSHPQLKGIDMRNPPIDATALIARLRDVNEDYANTLEDAVDGLNKRDGNVLSPIYVSIFSNVARQLGQGDIEERKLSGELREFIKTHY